MRSEGYGCWFCLELRRPAGTMPAAFLRKRLSFSEIASVASAIPTADVCLSFVSCLPQIVGLLFL